MDGNDTEEDSWTSADGDGEGEGEGDGDADGEGDCENGCSSSSVISEQQAQKKHFPPKTRELVPGCTVPVEVRPNVNPNYFCFSFACSFNRLPRF